MKLKSQRSINRILCVFFVSRSYGSQFLVSAQRMYTMEGVEGLLSRYEKRENYRVEKHYPPSTMAGNLSGAEMADAYGGIGSRIWRYARRSPLLRATGSSAALWDTRFSLSPALEPLARL